MIPEKDKKLDPNNISVFFTEGGKMQEIKEKRCDLSSQVEDESILKDNPTPVKVKIEMRTETVGGQLLDKFPVLTEVVCCLYKKEGRCTNFKGIDTPCVLETDAWTQILKR